MLSQQDTLWMVHEGWEMILQSQKAGGNESTATLPNGLLGIVEKICQTFHSMAKSEASGLKADLQF